jgi:hypothetical protein
MPAPLDIDPDRRSINSHNAEAYSTDYFDGLCQKIFLQILFMQITFFFLIASVADLADLLKSEPQDDFIVGLQNDISDIFSTPLLYSLAHVIKKKLHLYLNKFFSIKCHDLLLRFIQQPDNMRPVSTDNLSLLTSLLKDLEIVGMTNNSARELDSILRRPHIRVKIHKKNFCVFF